MSHRPVITDAIAGRKLLEFRYHEVQRSVRPHILGFVGPGRGELALSGWQVSGTGAGWRLFHLDEIEALTGTGQRFHGAAPGYNPDDPSFSRIVKRL